MLRLSAFIGLIALFFSFPAFAQRGDFPSQSDNEGTFTFVWENDYFANTDRNYTNGLRLAYLSGFKKPNGVSRWVADTILNAGPDAGIRRGFAIGHSIFTPQDIAETAPLPDQHPYAGWLYGEYSVVVEQQNIIDQVTIQAGIIGPAAQGAFVQNNWHDIIGGAPVNGWDNQIGNEPGLIIAYDRKYRAIVNTPIEGLAFDVTPSLGASAGNAHINGRLGLTFRIGEGLDADYGPPRVRPSLAGSGFFARTDRFNWYIFAGAEARAVAHNIFLDGSLFRETDPSVDSNTFVGDFQLGLALQYRGAQIAYTNVFRTQEFKTQRGAQQFGAVSISFKF